MKRWLALILLAVLIALLAYGCHDRRRTRAVQATAAAAAMQRAAEQANAAAAPDPMPGADPRTLAALYASSDVLHRYLQLAGAAKWAEADALWAEKRQPAPDEEGGFRQRVPARAMRIRNNAPVPVDGGSPPRRVRIPVHLVVNAKDGHTYRFGGEYTLRSNEITHRWELVGAHLRPEGPGY